MFFQSVGKNVHLNSIPLPVSQLDYSILRFLNHHHIPGSVTVMQFISDYTTYFNIASIVIVLLLAWNQHSGRLLRQSFILLTVLVISSLLVYLLKSVIDRDRPFYLYPDIVKLSTGGDSSFPSGHTLETFAMATAFTFLFRKKKISLLYYTWAVLVGYTRLALGVHYPSDVSGGAFLGILFGVGIPYLAGKLARTKEKITQHQRTG